MIAAALALPSSGVAKKKKKSTVAMFPFVVEGKPNKDIVGAVALLLTKATSFIDTVKILEGKKLKKKLRKKPQKAAMKCGPNPACLAGLGKKARAQEVLLVRAKPSDAGVAVSCVVIKVSDQSLARKVKLEFSDVSDVKRVLGGALFEIFGITDPGFLEVAGATGAVKIDGVLVGTGPGPYEVAPGRHKVSVGGQELAAMIMPGKTRTLEVEGGAAAVAAAPPPPPPAQPDPIEPATDPVELASATADLPEEDSAVDDLDRPLDEIAAAPEEGASLELAGDTTAAIEPDAGVTETAGEGGSAALTYVGITVAGAGVVLAVVGAIFGGQASGLHSDAEASDFQLEAIRLQNEGNDAATLANVFLIAGSGLAAVGLTLTVLDLFVLEPEVSVQPGGGAAVTATLRW